MSCEVSTVVIFLVKLVQMTRIICITGYEPVSACDVNAVHRDLRPRRRQGNAKVRVAAACRDTLCLLALTSEVIDAAQILEACRPLPHRDGNWRGCLQFIPQSPFVAKLGIVAEVLDGDEVRLRLPWDESNVTVGDMVHGGAIAALADVAVMAAAWSGAQVPDSLRGVTTLMSMQFLAPARATDLIAIGRVLRRGKSLVNCDVDVVTPEGDAVAKAIATYKVGWSALTAQLLRCDDGASLDFAVVQAGGRPPPRRRAGNARPAS